MSSQGASFEQRENAYRHRMSIGIRAKIFGVILRAQDNFFLLKLIDKSSYGMTTKRLVLRVRRRGVPQESDQVPVQWTATPYSAAIRQLRVFVLDRRDGFGKVRSLQARF